MWMFWANVSFPDAQGLDSCHSPHTDTGHAAVVAPRPCGAHLIGPSFQWGCYPSPELDEQPLCQMSWERQILAQGMRGSESQAAVKRHFLFFLGLGTK